MSTDPTTEPDFNPAEIAKAARARVNAERRTRAQEFAARAAAEQAFDDEMTRRAEQVHNRQAARAQAEADFREAEARRVAALPADEIVRRIRRNR